MISTGQCPHYLVAQLRKIKIKKNKKNTTTGPEGRFILIEGKREIRIVCFLYSMISK
jgi:hypothetical protein